LRSARVRPRLGGLVIAVVAVVALAISAAASRIPLRSVDRPTHRVAPAAAPAHPAAAANGTLTTLAAAKLPALNKQQLAGQRIIYSYSGLNPPASLLWLIRHGDAAGVIFFGQNISSEAQIHSVVTRLDAANQASANPVRQPLLLMTDQEGGEVRRLPGAPNLSEKQIGQASHPGGQAAAAGRGAGKNLRGVGMNVNLAPVLDVYRQAGNFIDEFGRSYSDHASVVAPLGRDFIKAQQKLGVAATVKHFPGLGAASRSQNTDERPVTLKLSKNSIRTTDEKPYRWAIAAGTKLVMVSWAKYPALAQRPAGLSSNIVQGELRQRLGFGGVTITDALEAGALRDDGSTSQRAFMAARAGMDLILCSAQNVGQGSAARGKLAQAYASGQLNGTSFKAAVTRVLALRGWVG
jgi:beta-N-acetylhexosaminidase